jgi:hypothetical protein
MTFPLEQFSLTPASPVHPPQYHSNAVSPQDGAACGPKTFAMRRATEDGPGEGESSAEAVT